MKIKLDENMPSSLVADLSALGHDVDTAPAEGLAGHSDPVEARAARAGRTWRAPIFGHRAVQILSHILEVVWSFGGIARSTPSKEPDFLPSPILPPSKRFRTFTATAG
jgi:hypothetical protein